MDMVECTTHYGRTKQVPKEKLAFRPDGLEAGHFHNHGQVVMDALHFKIIPAAGDGGESRGEAA